MNAAGVEARLREEAARLWADHPGERPGVVGELLGREMRACLQHESWLDLHDVDEIAERTRPDGERDRPAMTRDRNELREDPRKRWPLLWAGDADGSRGADSLVEDLIHAGTVGEFFGAHGTFKTMLVLDLAAHITQGIPWRGLTTQLRGCVYVAAEGGGGIESRIAALRLEHPEMPPRGLVVVRSAVDLRDLEDVSDFAEQLLEEVVPQIQGGVGFLVFDTFSQSMPGGNENAGEDVTLVERNVRHLLAHLARAQGGMRPAAALIHHTGKDRSRGPRGHSAQSGNFDWLLATERTDKGDVPLEERVFALRAVKVKDGPDGTVWGYRGKLVQVGAREGRPLLAPVVREADPDELRGSAANAGAPYSPRPGSRSAAVLDAMKAERLRNPTQHVPVGVLRAAGYHAELEARGGDGSVPVPGVRRNDVVRRLQEMEGRTDRTQADAGRARRNEAIRRLERRGVIRNYEGWMWWTS